MVRGCICHLANAVLLCLPKAEEVNIEKKIFFEGSLLGPIYSEVIQKEKTGKASLHENLSGCFRVVAKD